MDQVLTAPGQESIITSERRKGCPAQFGNVDAGTALFTLPSLSTRMGVVLLCMAATGTQLMMRSLPFVATVGDNGMAKQYDWDEQETGNLFAAFGWGYAISQIPGSILAQKYGHKNVYLVITVGGAVANMFVPIASSLTGGCPESEGGPSECDQAGLWGAMAVRFTFGVFQGSLFPIQTGILAAWLHENERSTIKSCVGLCWSLFQAIQTTLTPMFMNGIGWEYAFYFYSILVFMWAPFWHRHGVGIEPREVPRCSQAERQYLTGSESPPTKEFDMMVWWTTVKQPVVWGMALTTVIEGFGKPVFLTYVSRHIITACAFGIGCSVAHNHACL
jgi:ACS family glucarate transporter-like MFS transporter